MDKRNGTAWLVTCAVAAVVTIIVLIPFHATLTVFLSQFVGHYTVLRLWKEFLQVPLVVIAVYVYVRNQEVRRQINRSKLTWLIFAYLLVLLIWGLVSLATGLVTSTALGYGWIVDGRFLIFFLVVWVIVQAAPHIAHVWSRLVFVPAALVLLVGLLQYFALPYDFMKHLGYSAATIYPYEDINHNTAYIRVMSTLRGANPLGAYLLLVITLGVAWAGTQLQRLRQKYIFAPWIVGIYLVASISIFALTFSRGAWVGLLASLGVLAWIQRNHISRRRVIAAGGILSLLAVVLGVLTFGLRSPAVQNVILHTEDTSTITTTSNEGHASALQAGVRDVAQEPLGRGPGTAGPASVYNTGHPARIAENYFIQLAQETGWLGLGLFLAICLLVAKRLWNMRTNALALGLLAALVGLSVANLFSHAWADDTLAYLWWGLAGLACGGLPFHHAR